MRWCQANKIPLPEYTVKGQYNGTFHIEVLVEGVSYGAGFGKTKKDAEQNAAYIALSTTPRFKSDSHGLKRKIGAPEAAGEADRSIGAMRDRKIPASRPPQPAEQAAPAQIQAGKGEKFACFAPPSINAPGCALRRLDLLGRKGRGAICTAADGMNRQPLAICGRREGQVQAAQFAEQRRVCSAGIPDTRRPFDAIRFRKECTSVFQPDRFRAQGHVLPVNKRPATTEGERHA